MRSPPARVTIQFDFPLYPYLVDPAWVERFEGPATTWTTLRRRARSPRTRAILEGIPDDVTTALHICRGNFRSSWMCEGSLEPVADQVFGRLPYDAFLVEWDDEGRDGGFEPVRSLRRGSVMVMGIVSTKTPELEDEDELLRRMEEAAAFVGGDLDRLAISPQCGFASVWSATRSTRTSSGASSSSSPGWRTGSGAGDQAKRLGPMKVSQSSSDSRWYSRQRAILPSRHSTSATPWYWLLPR